MDIEKDTWQMDVNDIEKINDKTKAIMVVHLFGHPVDMDPVIEIAKKHKLKIIEDCVRSHGVKYKNKTVGSLDISRPSAFTLIKLLLAGKVGWLSLIPGN